MGEESNCREVSEWPLSFSYGEPQAMLQALQSKNRRQFVLNFHFSPLSYLSKSIFLMFFQGVRARNRQLIVNLPSYCQEGKQSFDRVNLIIFMGDLNIIKSII